MIELQKLGLSYYESRIVEVLLKEKTNLRDLSRKSNVPFGKIYSVVKILKGKGIIEETNSRPKLVYIENASEVIDKLINENLEKRKDVFEELREIAINSDKEKGKRLKFFDIGTTVEDNKRIQLRTFTESKNEVLQIINIHHKSKSNRESKTLWEKEILKAVERGVIFKAIYPENAVLPVILQRLNKEHPNKFHIKRINTDFARCDIINGKKILLKLVHEDPLQFGGIIFIQNEKLAQNLKKIFLNMWDSD